MSKKTFESNSAISLFRLQPIQVFFLLRRLVLLQQIQFKQPDNEQVKKRAWNIYGMQHIKQTLNGIPNYSEQTNDGTEVDFLPNDLQHASGGKKQQRNVASVWKILWPTTDPPTQGAKIFLSHDIVSPSDGLRSDFSTALSASKTCFSSKFIDRSRELDKKRNCIRH